jgi:serine phosphatase RsbU (regulator of sigma subunit)
VYGYFDFNAEQDWVKFIFANGGHPKPIRMTAKTQNIEFLDAGGTIIGGFPNMSFEEQTVSLARGDRLFVYTDGIPEAMDAEGRIIGFDEMRDIITGSYHQDLGMMLDRIIGCVRRHNDGRPLDDDLLLIGFEIQ